MYNENNNIQYLVDSVVRTLEASEHETKDSLVDMMIKLAEDSKNGFNVLFNQ